MSRESPRGERAKAGHQPAVPAWRSDWLLAGLAADPTWTIDGPRFEGVTSLGRLAELSRFAGAEG